MADRVVGGRAPAQQPVDPTGRGTQPVSTVPMALLEGHMAIISAIKEGAFAVYSATLSHLEVEIPFVRNIPYMSPPPTKNATSIPEDRVKIETLVREFYRHKGPRGDRLRLSKRHDTSYDLGYPDDEEPWVVWGADLPYAIPGKTKEHEDQEWGEARRELTEIHGDVGFYLAKYGMVEWDSKFSNLAEAYPEGQRNRGVAEADQFLLQGEERGATKNEPPAQETKVRPARVITTDGAGGW